MTTERDELLADVRTAYSHRITFEDGTTSIAINGPEDMAETLGELGYRKPRTVTTAEELEALPVGSVILDADGEAWQNFHRNSLRTKSQKRWRNWVFDDEEYGDIDLPATVLHVGGTE